MTTPEPSPYAPAATPTTAQPYFVPNVVVLALSVLLLIGFIAKDALLQVLFDWQLLVAGVALVLSIGLFVTSLVLRSKTKRAGGSVALPIISIIVSAVNLVLILATIVVVIVIFGLLFYLFTGGF
jgi:hypothetical protein